VLDSLLAAWSREAAPGVRSERRGLDGGDR